MYVLMQLAFLYTVLLCLPSIKRVTVAYYMSVCLSAFLVFLPIDDWRMLGPTVFKFDRQGG